jgi:hypothetical protein
MPTQVVLFPPNTKPEAGQLRTSCYCQVMGRGQGKVADSFSRVFGEQRGLQYEQVPFSSAPAAVWGSEPFSLEIGTARRLMGLSSYLLDQTTTREWSFEELIRLSGVYGFGNDGLCSNDLDMLVKQGIFEATMKQTATANYLLYRVVPVASWSEAHQARFAAWQKAGSPES